MSNTLLGIIVVVLLVFIVSGLLWDSLGLIKCRRDMISKRELERVYYQAVINECVNQMSDDACTPEQWDELEWSLHSLVYEYRRL